VKPDGAESVTEPPLQNVVGPPAVMLGVLGGLFIVTTVAALTDEVHPLSIVLTVYEPAVFTVIDCVVSLFDHK
ncbi:hypothetical protein, partial [Umezakia ovalisporum]|uniref:hypothetical protein n=1 Tax=Umezakia ovalisporum TaxID=75695 RepID=UPI0039C6EA88